MPLTRHFLGWERPLCETVPAWLLTARADGTVDLRGTVVVTPTRQSSWRLRAALPLAAHAHGAALLGPEIVTAPALLTPPPRANRASDLQSLLAWCAVLKAVPAGDMDAFLGAQRPSTSAWALQIARRLTALREELADGALSIAEVAAQGAEIEEPERWAAMAELERRCLERLKSWSLRDPIADQLAHARAGAVAPEVRQVVVAAVPDPPRLLMMLLDTWSQAGGRVDVLVAAPQAEEAAFDAWGRPLPEVWDARSREIALDDADILLAANPEDQAGCIAERVAAGIAAAASSTQAKPAGNLRPALAVGVPDPETVAPLQRELAAIGLPAFDPRNHPFADTPLFRLVQALLAWQARPGYAESATLLRHPDVLAALPDADAALRELDTLQPEHLPVTFDDLQRLARTPALAAALAHLASWREVLAQPSLAAGLRTALQAVYAERQLLAERPADAFFRAAAATLDEALRELSAAEEAGQAGSDAAAALLARLQGASIKPERGDEQLDLEGWLELAWNPAPLLFVAGVNEGFVPDSHVGDLFLPDGLRAKLALRDDRARVARDAYLLTALRAPRQAGGRMFLLVGRTSTAGDPLRPSRLLFRCPDARLVARAQKLFSQPPPVHAAAAYAVSFMLDPTAAPTAALDHLSPTAFRDYLACPLHFYLGRVLKMKAVDDRAREPDSGAFGDLCHAVVEAMGRARIWACGDEARLAQWLEARLQDEARARYGAQPWLGVTLAVASAARRLRAFAAQQVAWHAQGWEIIAAEQRDLACTLDGVAIRGRLDRIDRHRDGSYCVLDYKTTDTAKSPDAVHLAPAGGDDFLPEATLTGELSSHSDASGRRSDKPRRWVDLQLPLYREMARGRYGPDVRLGYALLPKTLGETGFAVWEGYTDALHAHAIACARAVLCRIRAGQFWPPAPRMPAFSPYGDLLFDDPARFIRAPGTCRT